MGLLDQRLALEWVRDNIKGRAGTVRRSFVENLIQMVVAFFKISPEEHFDIGICTLKNVSDGNVS